ncbi:hypothetical protein [Halobacillus litoralis]|uniref:hypothetical protein n=1 Tax=Halobacillus litoralis TaxID=45668 RepID=UPI001CFC6889|nr:hypothetical protein [Halobacillus litoralis]
MKNIFLAVLSLIAFLFLRPKKVKAPTIKTSNDLYPGTDCAIMAGDLLFSPIGKSESKYVGHVGFVMDTNEVVHSIPSGLARDSISTYFKKFRGITLYRPKSTQSGSIAALYMEDLFATYPKALYRVWTPLGTSDYEQYCTKLVWQAYYFGSNINLGHLPLSAKAVHPVRIKDRKYLKRKW